MRLGPDPTVEERKRPVGQAALRSHAWLYVLRTRLLQLTPGKALHFYTFPKDAELRRLWLKNVSHAGVSGCFSTFQPTMGHRLCSVHFQGGRKTYMVHVPTIFPLRGVNERKVARRPAGAAAARRRQQQQQQQQPSPSSSTAQIAQLQPNLVSASAAVLLTLQAAVDSSQAPGSVAPAPTIPSGDDVKPMDLTVQVE
ncbi:THAP domain-containing protein 11 [Lemmus lemmus]